MRVLVTGATGFVGSHLAEALARAGHEVVVTLRASSDPRWLAGVVVDRVALDLDAPERMSAALAGIETIVHAAGVTRAARMDDYRRVNVDGTRALVTAAVAAGVRSCVLVSSLAARGPDGGDGPASAYGRSKREAEEVAIARAGDRLGLTVLRLAAVYGPRDVDLLPLFRVAASGLLPLPARSGLLQPVFVADVAALVLRLVAEPADVGPWPVAAARVHRWDELPPLLAASLGRPVRALYPPPAWFVTAAAVVEAVAALRGRPPTFDRRRALDLAAHAYTCDVGPTEAATGWHAEVDLAAGLRRTAAWYRQHGWLR